MCVKSKNDQSGQDGAALATLPRRQYESFFVVKKTKRRSEMGEAAFES